VSGVMDEELLVDDDDHSAGKATSADVGRQGRRKRLTFTITASELIGLAVNVVQNKCDVEAGIDPNMRKALEEIYDDILRSNRLEVEMAMRRRRRAS
jgi:hypothetical protein